MATTDKLLSPFREGGGGGGGGGGRRGERERERERERVHNEAPTSDTGAHSIVPTILFQLYNMEERCIV